MSLLFGSGMRRNSRQRHSRRLGIENLESRKVLSVSPVVNDIAVSSTDWDSDFVDFVNTSSIDDIGYSIPTGSTAQTDPLPWNNINKISITFSEDVFVDSSDLALTGVNNSQYAPDDFYYDPVTHVATWTFSNYLPADRFMIDLDADGLDAVADLEGNILDGDWIDEVSSGPSGNGVAGGDLEFTFEVLPGDVDQTSLVNFNDFFSIRVLTGNDTTSPNYSAFRDVDGSGHIGNPDWLGIINLLGSYSPSGTPAGEFNDAPTTSHIGLVDIDSAEVDVAISLFGAFDDMETPDNQITYQVVGDSNPNLLDYGGMNTQTGTFHFTALESANPGRTTLTIRATDSSGLSVDTSITVDVYRDNLPPVLFHYSASELPGNTWIISGNVSDSDDDLEEIIVNFSGLRTMRAAVDETGYFEFAIIAEPNEWGFLDAVAVDPHGAESNLGSVFIGLT